MLRWNAFLGFFSVIHYRTGKTWAANVPPNIVMVVADDLGWNDVSFHGSTQILTPHIDGLAKKGIILNNYYVNPICTPSRSSLLTGKYPIHLGTQQDVIYGLEPWGLGLEEKTLPEYLRELGYRTHAVGKTYLIWSSGPGTSNRAETTWSSRQLISCGLMVGQWYVSRTYPKLALGSGEVGDLVVRTDRMMGDDFLRYIRKHPSTTWHLGFFDKRYTPVYRGFEDHYGYWLGHTDYFDHTAQEAADWGLDLRSNLDPVLNQTSQYVTDLFTKKAEQVIFNHNKSEPLFLYLAHLAVHSANTYDPLQTTKQYYDRFPHISHNGRRLFAGMAAGLDESVGRVLKALQDRGLGKNTIFVFTTDNGGPAAGFNLNHANNWPLRGVKDTLWEGGTRGSALIWSPLLKETSRVSTQMMHISDWLPTLLSAAGKNPTALKDLDGKDMWLTLSKNKPSPRTEILLNIDHERQIYALRVKDYKLLIGSTYEGKWDGWYPPENGTTENLSGDSPAQVKCVPPEDPEVKKSCQPLKGPCLFNIAKDPCEFRNLAVALPEKLAEMMQRLRDYNGTVVPPRNKPPDERAKPQWHGYIWTPWINSA